MFLERGEGKEKEGDRNISVWLPLAHLPLGTQACALTGNRTSGPLVCRLAFSPLSRTSQGELFLWKGDFQVFPMFGGPLSLRLCLYPGVRNPGFIPASFTAVGVVSSSPRVLSTFLLVGFLEMPLSKS